MREERGENHVFRNVRGKRERGTKIKREGKEKPERGNFPSLLGTHVSIDTFKQLCDERIVQKTKQKKHILWSAGEKE